MRILGRGLFHRRIAAILAGSASSGRLRSWRHRLCRLGPLSVLLCLIRPSCRLVEGFEPFLSRVKLVLLKFSFLIVSILLEFPFKYLCYFLNPNDLI